MQASVGTGRVLNDIPFPSDFRQFTTRNATTATLQAGIPLLKNRGGKISQSTEIAAGQILQAVTNNKEFVASNQITKSVLAYWNYQAQWQSLAIYRQAEQRAKSVLGDSKFLIEAEKKPAADLAQIEADLALKISQRMLSEQAFFQARQELGREMGLDYQESINLNPPTGAFPSLISAEKLDTLSAENLLERVLAGRADLLAQAKQIEAEETLTDAAKQNLLPNLQANFFVQRSGLQYGDNAGNYFTPFAASEGSTMDYGGGLSLVIPIQNNVAKGNLAKEKSRLTYEQIAYKNQIRNIKTNLSIAINQMKISRNILLQSKIAYDKSNETFSNETLKYQRGLTTLLNLIIFQERLTGAELNYIQAEQQFANSIAMLRFESGTIGNSSGGIDSTVFYTIP